MKVKTEKKADSSETIFIQIACYRDPQLLPTLRDMLEKANQPDNLRIGIAWQHSQEDIWDSLLEYSDDPRFRILDIDAKESQGVCWARNLVQQTYMDEKYTLQLDSHHRFSQDWDLTLINMIKGLQDEGVPKPLLTAYIPSFNPEKDPEERVQEPWKMNFDRFIPEGAIFFLPASFDEWDDKDKPLPGRFYSAHFAFTLGIFAKEVMHDPEYYFHGEEINIAVRAYTHGYDIYHPNKVICWHEYTRKGRAKHWDDDTKWGGKNERSHLRNRKLFEMDGESRDIDFGKYGLGSTRSLTDYERYSGISFKKRAIQQSVLDHKAPPDPLQYADEKEVNEGFLSIFKHCIDLGFDQTPEKDYDFWAVAFKDKDNKELHRQDADSREIKRMKKDPDGYYKIWREFQTLTQPASWIVWPHSKSKGWSAPIEGYL